VAQDVAAEVADAQIARAVAQQVPGEDLRDLGRQQDRMGRNPGHPAQQDKPGEGYGPTMQTVQHGRVLP